MTEKNGTGKNMRTVKNDVLGFSFDIPADYGELEEPEFARLDTDGSALHVFAKRSGGGIRIISLVRDADFYGEEEYLGIVEAGVCALELAGMTVEERSFSRAGDRRTDSVELSFGDLKFAVYYTHVCGVAISAAVEVDEFGDECHRDAENLFVSVRET